MEKTIDELRTEADQLGIKYSQNIGAAKLSAKIEEFYKNQSAGGSVDKLVEKAEEADVKSTKKDGPKGLQEIRKEAMATRVVTLTLNDKKENDKATVAPLSVENAYFGVSKLVPLDMPVELENCLIELAQSLKCTAFTDEIVNGKRTGNHKISLVRKYVVSFEDTPVVG